MIRRCRKLGISRLGFGRIINGRRRLHSRPHRRLICHLHCQICIIRFRRHLRTREELGSISVVGHLVIDVTISRRLWHALHGLWHALHGLWHALRDLGLHHLGLHK